MKTPRGLRQLGAAVGGRSCLRRGEETIVAPEITPSTRSRLRSSTAAASCRTPRRHLLLALLFTLTPLHAKPPTPTKPKPIPAKPAAPTPPPAAPSTPGPDADTRQKAQSTYDEAMASFRHGNLPAAKDGLQKVLTLSPGNVPALLNLGLVEQRQKNYDDAEHHLRQILQADQQSASAWLLLGIGAYEQGKLDAAHAHLAQAVLYAPKNAQAHQFLGVVLGRKGWYSAGEEELRRAVELDPNQSESHYNLAVLYMEHLPPSTELARRHYQRALELGAQPDPDLAQKIDAATN